MQKEYATLARDLRLAFEPIPAILNYIAAY